jgi:hypothetical protein
VTTSASSLAGRNQQWDYVTKDSAGQMPYKITTGASRQRAACLDGPSLPRRRPRTHVSFSSSRLWDGDTIVFLFGPVAPAGNDAAALRIR